jgi:hypothetical protein
MHGTMNLKVKEQIANAGKLILLYNIHISFLWR